MKGGRFGTGLELGFNLKVFFHDFSAGNNTHYVT